MTAIQIVNQAMEMGPDNSLLELYNSKRQLNIICNLITGRQMTEGWHSGAVNVLKLISDKEKAMDTPEQVIRLV